MIEHLTLRVARPHDAQAIARMSRDRIEAGLGWRWNEARVLQSLADPATNVIVAQSAGAVAARAEPLGFGIMKYRNDEAHLLLLAVRADACRRGAGTALVGWLEKSARAAGLGQIYLEARITNAAARAFYAELGYFEIQTLPGYYAGREACVRLAKDLWLEPWERA